VLRLNKGVRLYYLLPPEKHANMVMWAYY